MSIKLNKTQINVLAKEIYSELEKEANKYKESEEYKNFEDTLKNEPKMKPYLELEKAFKKFEKDSGYKLDKYYVNRLLEDKIDYIKEQKKLKFPPISVPSITTIENKIILKTIDCPNVDELIASVKESLKVI